MIAAFFDRFLVPEWRLAHLLWSVRIAIFWTALAGLWIALPAFQDYFDPIHFAILSVVCSVSIGVARLTHQPGLE